MCIILDLQDHLMKMTLRAQGPAGPTDAGTTLPTGPRGPPGIQVYSYQRDQLAHTGMSPS